MQHEPLMRYEMKNLKIHSFTGAELIVKCSLISFCAAEFLTAQQLQTLSVCVKWQQVRNVEVGAAARLKLHLKLMYVNRTRTQLESGTIWMW